jgi:hypothetical protein
MISLSKLLKIKIFLYVLIAIIFFGCNREPEKKKYVARVNDSYLTEEELSELDSLFQQSASRSEIIKRWVDKELLYQEAISKGVTDDEEFNSIINNSRRELAASMLLNKHMDVNLKKPNNAELQGFYNQHINEFRTDENIYVFNSASFKNENTAIRFRTKLVEKNWEKIIDNYAEDTMMIAYRSGDALSEDEIYPIQLLNLIKELNPNEISIVLEESSDKYSVIQLVQSFKKGAIPPLELLEDEVMARFISEKREEILNKYLEELYSNNEIEIKEK